MRKLTLIAILGILVLSVGEAQAEQIRLRNGHLLQCQVIQKQSDEKFLTVRLYATGGVFQIRWEHLIPEDEDRLRDALGLKPWEETEVPTTDAHEITFTNGSVDQGLALNPKDQANPLKLKKSSGVRQYARDRIGKIKEIILEIIDVYSLEEIYEKYLEEVAPETGAQHSELAERLMQVGDYVNAKKHYDLALEDPEFPEEKALVVRNRLQRVTILVRAMDAVKKVRDIMRLRARKKFDEALEGIKGLQGEYAESPAILKELNLDRLHRRVVSDRRKYLVKEVQRRFHRVFKTLITKKCRDREAAINEVLVWALNPKALKQEIFDKIAEDLGIESAEAKDLWDNRTTRQPRRYNYGAGTFIHPEVAGRTKRTPTKKRSSRNRNQRGRAQPQKQQKPKTKDEWWKLAKGKARENFVKAWFAEFEPEILKVLRIEKRTCTNCAGKGVTISHAVAGAEEIKTICPHCNLAGHERIVICR